MPTIAQIRDAFRAGIANNSADPEDVALLQSLRGGLRDGADTVTDFDSAVQYLATTAAGDMDEGQFRLSLAQVNANLATLPATGAVSVRALRNKIRALLVDGASPQWLKDACELVKRTWPLDATPEGAPQYDQEATDPIVALADAALVTITDAGADATAEELTAAAAVIAKFVTLTPDQPTE